MNKYCGLCTCGNVVLPSYFKPQRKHFKTMAFTEIAKNYKLKQVLTT
jgi:hypothetical protein